MENYTKQRIKELVESINEFEYDRMSESGQAALEEIYHLLLR